jgi:hypothetical protein
MYRSTSPTVCLTRPASLLLLSIALGCSGGDENDSEKGPANVGCGIELETSGAVDYSLSFDEYACVYSSSDEGVYVTFLPVDDVSDGITLEIDEIRIDETGQFPGSLQIRFGDSEVYEASDCVFDVKTHVPDDGGTDDIGLPYKLSGTGSCPNDAQEQTTGDTLMVADFRFATLTAWRQ